jgi:hypothetical protein
MILVAGATIWFFDDHAGSPVMDGKTPRSWRGAEDEGGLGQNGGLVQFAEPR